MCCGEYARGIRPTPSRSSWSRARIKTPTSSKRWNWAQMIMSQSLRVRGCSRAGESTSGAPACGRSTRAGQRSVESGERATQEGNDGSAQHRPEPAPPRRRKRQVLGIVDPPASRPLPPTSRPKLMHSDPATLASRLKCPGFCAAPRGRSGDVLQLFERRLAALPFSLLASGASP